MTIRRTIAAAAITIPLAMGLGHGTAAAAPVDVPVQVPVVTGFQIAPGAVPGGFFQTIPMKATVGNRPGEVTFSAAAIAPYADQYPYRYLTLSWRNLVTGATGTVDLRHWVDERPEGAPPTPAEGLPTEATAATGAGPVGVTVTHFRDYDYGDPYVDTLIPGLGIVMVP